MFCFCTPPDVRLPLVLAGIDSGARLIAFEKPVAMTSAEGMAIKQAIDTAGVKAVVSHQHRYGEHYQKVKGIIASGAIGTVQIGLRHSHRLDGAHAQPPRRLHSWFNDYSPPNGCMAQAAGRGKLTDVHASPDYIGGFVHFRNGVRGIYECGAGRAGRCRGASTGGASAASARRAPKDMPRCRPVAAGAR